SWAADSMAPRSSSPESICVDPWLWPPASGPESPVGDSLTSSCSDVSVLGLSCLGSTGSWDADIEVLHWLKCTIQGTWGHPAPFQEAGEELIGSFSRNRAGCAPPGPKAPSPSQGCR